MENAVVYARYSSHSQTEQSIEGQLAAAHTYAASKGYNIIHEYCDRAKTGTNDNREEFQKMLSDCGKKPFSVIIVWKVDRFGRNREEITFNKYKAKKAGVRVEYIAENITEGPEGVILESVLEGMAEYYSLQLSQNIKRGVFESAKKHKFYGGSIPIGYKVNDDKEFEIDPDKCKVVHRIFEQYANGMSMAQLVNWLNINGYRTTKGNLFNKNSLPRLLHNEAYRGVYKYKDSIYDEEGMPRIVSDELFYKVQEMLNINKIASSRWDKDYYFLTGKLFCQCGGSMNGKSAYNKKRIKYRYYVCKDCHKRINASNIEQLVVDHIHGILNDDAVLENITEAVWKYYQQNSHENDEIESIEGRLVEIEKFISNLTKAVEEGMPYDVIKNRLENLNDEKETLIYELSFKQSKKESLLTRDKIKFFITQFRYITDNRQLTNTLINSIHIGEDEVSVALNYSEEHCLPSLVKVELSKQQANTFILDGVIVIKVKEKK